MPRGDDSGWGRDVCGTRLGTHSQRRYDAVPQAQARITQNSSARRAHENLINARDYETDKLSISPFPAFGASRRRAPAVRLRRRTPAIRSTPKPQPTSTSTPYSSASTARPRKSGSNAFMPAYARSGDRRMPRLSAAARTVSPATGNLRPAAPNPSPGSPTRMPTGCKT